MDEQIIAVGMQVVTSLAGTKRRWTEPTVDTFMMAVLAHVQARGGTKITRADVVAALEQLGPKGQSTLQWAVKAYDIL